MLGSEKVRVTSSPFRLKCRWWISRRSLAAAGACLPRFRNRLSLLNGAKRTRRCFSRPVSSPFLRLSFFHSEASTYTTASRLSDSPAPPPPSRGGDSGAGAGGERRGRVGSSVYLFERSKNYRSGAASRRCLSFDRGATMRGFARYLPWLRCARRPPLRSTPLRSAPFSFGPPCVLVRARVPLADTTALTANALTHFSRAEPFLPCLVFLFPPFPSPSRAFSPLLPLSANLHPHETLLPLLFVSPFPRIPFSRRSPRVPPPGHPPFARLVHPISLAEGRGRVRCPRHVVLMHVIAANLIKPAD